MAVQQTLTSIPAVLAKPSSATPAGSAGRPVHVTSGTKIGSWPERTKSSLAANLKSG
ncbi:hypothetical protein HO173_003137 [Letharia columbiana]|uniref:Uncharacterized protein n=1 Tax=Letharia columbiana TaxID=112416 RepID=A0A8H6L7Q7_9LECA|nr:uncharacterized protein HO173_003137 [Letharia columbiana]KAF6238631.1 hypothetical protein HO173_003137 [Letharia columbiana]